MNAMTKPERRRLRKMRRMERQKSRALVKVEPVPPVVKVEPAPLPAPPRPHLQPAARPTRWLLSASALALAGSGIVINGWFARSLGSTEVAGWLFLTVGVAADVCALALPSVAAHLRGPRRALAWALWTMTVAWALIASIGFVSVNVADVAATRSSPGVELARRIADAATVARQGECLRRGPLCRDREADERAALAKLEAARADVVVDPQVAGASKLIAWATAGLVQPSTSDVALARLLLLTLLPQIGGLVLLVARVA
jgi:hypothetical protein